MTQSSPAGGILFYVAPLLSAGVAWLATQFAAVIHIARAALAFVFGAGVGDFIADPAHFPGICMVTVALIQIVARGFMWWKDNTLRRERDDLLKANLTQAKRIGALEGGDHRRRAHR